jgi:HPt (histidine-containing phosphotransfer) domain-containing protein
VSIQHIDDEALNELQLVMGDDFGKLLQTFASDSVARIAAIEQTAAAADSEALRRAAHSFKGSSGNMGARQLSELCRLIEEYAREGAVERCMPLIAELSSEFALVQGELSRYTH